MTILRGERLKLVIHSELAETSYKLFQYFVSVLFSDSEIKLKRNTETVFGLFQPDYHFHVHSHVEQACPRPRCRCNMRLSWITDYIRLSIT